MTEQQAPQNTECLDEETLSRKSVIIASNRGPLSFSTNSEGETISRRGSGGLVTALSGVIQNVDATWVSCAMSPEDAEFKHGTLPITDQGDEIQIQFVTPTLEQYEGYYNHISNPLLWFLQHSMWNLPSAPVIASETWEAWESGYVEVNHMFADQIRRVLRRKPGPSLVMLQDYHLYLAAGFLRQSLPPRRRPAIMHFTHIPWPGPDYWAILPPTMRNAILEGMCAVDVLGFQTGLDAYNFLRTCDFHLPRASVKYKNRRIWYRNHASHVRAFPISIDVESLRDTAISPDCTKYTPEIEDIARENQLVLRIDRIEPSKNIVRGFQAFEEMLEMHPEHREKVTFLALLVPSRLDVVEYQSYLDELMAAAGHVNAVYGTENWEPVRVLVSENYMRAVAALKRYDVLLVNSIADGMNLVAKEGPIVNQRDGVLILSERTGAVEQLGSGSIVISPCDVYATGQAIHQALVMDPEQRIDYAQRLRWAIENEDVSDWFCKQLDTVERLNL